jgi:hypothetical protein
VRSKLSIPRLIGYVPEHRQQPVHAELAEPDVCLHAAGVVQAEELVGRVVAARADR